MSHFFLPKSNVGKAIADEGNNYYLRARAAGITAAKIIRGGFDKKELPLTKKQLSVLDKIIVELEALPDDEDKFYDYCVKKYSEEVPNFNPKSYGF